MRILFTHAGGSGHLTPLLPFALIARSRGHEVGFVAQQRTRSQIEAKGFLIVTTAEPPNGQELASAFERGKELPTLFEQVDHGLREVFADIFTRLQIPAVLQGVDTWQPDLIVRDEADFGAAIAAELKGIPCVTVLVVAAGSFVRPELVAEPLNTLRKKHGLPPDPAMSMLQQDLTICPFPPSFRDPRFPLPASTLRTRLQDFEAAPTEGLPGWIPELEDQPTIYFSLGTVFNTIRKDLFKPIIEGLRDLPVNLIVTVGEDVDVCDFGEQPPNVHIEQFIPQEAILAYCNLVINHAGSGSLNGAIARGLPVIVVPLGADQPYNAQRCIDVGIGEALDASAVTPEGVRAIAQRLLGDRSYHEQAQRLREELLELPGPELAVQRIEQLT